MVIKDLPFGTVDWDTVEKERSNGETGHSHSRVQMFGGIRVRIVEYSAGYRADHWCTKGHILYCLEGEMTTELKDGRLFELRKGMSYQVEDGGYPHRSRTKTGATLFIVD